MPTMTRSAKVLIASGLVLTIFLTFFTAAGHIWNLCYVGTDGRSLYIGNGYIEYGYGWGWIRRRMFHVGGPELGWTFRRALPNLIGVLPEYAPYRVPLTISVAALAAMTYYTWKRGRLWDPPPHRHLVWLLVWGVIEVLFAILMTPIDILEVRRGRQSLLTLFLAMSTVAVPMIAVWIKHERNIAPGYCQKCRYDLTGNVSGICPECGTKVDKEFTQT